MVGITGGCEFYANTTQHFVVATFDDDGWQNYNINFKDKGISIIIMTNSDNSESIFKELLEKVIGDTFTPWQWERYTPYDKKAK